METVRFTQLGKADIRFGKGTFEVTLADGRVVTMDEVDIGDILTDPDLSTTITGVYVATVGGTADAITLTPTQPITAYAAGQRFYFITSGANTGAVTVAVSGLAAKAITKDVSTALVANDLASGKMVEITYDGTRFQLGLVATAFTGTGSVVRATSPTLVTPVLGVATGTSLNLSGNLGAGGTRSLGTGHIQGDVASSIDPDVGQLFITGATATTKRLICGFDTTANQGFIRAVQNGVTEKPLILQPVDGTNSGNVQIGAGNSLAVGALTARATTAGTNRIDIFDGTAPVGTLANGISLYSTAGELRVMDAAGTATLLSPHDAEGNWVYHSKQNSGRVLHVDMEKLVTALNEKFGWDFVRSYYDAD